MNMNDYDRYDLNINIQSLNIDAKFHAKLKKIATILEEVKTIDNGVERAYQHLTLRQDLTMVIFNNHYFMIKAHHNIDLSNIEIIQKISGFSCDDVRINNQGNLEVNFHNRDDK